MDLGISFPELFKAPRGSAPIVVAKLFKGIDKLYGGFSRIFVVLLIFFLYAVGD